MGSRKHVECIEKSHVGNRFPTIQHMAQTTDQKRPEYLQFGRRMPLLSQQRLQRKEQGYRRHGETGPQITSLQFKRWLHHPLEAIAALDSDRRPLMDKENQFCCVMVTPQ